MVNLGAKSELEAEKATQRYSNHVIAAHVYIRHKCLPSASNGHAFKEKRIPV